MMVDILRILVLVLSVVDTMQKYEGNSEDQDLVKLILFGRLELGKAKKRLTVVLFFFFEQNKRHIVNTISLFGLFLSFINNQINFVNKNPKILKS